MGEGRSGEWGRGEAEKGGGWSMDSAIGLDPNCHPLAGQAYLAAQICASNFSLLAGVYPRVRGQCPLIPR